MEPNNIVSESSPKHRNLLITLLVFIFLIICIVFYLLFVKSNLPTTNPSTLPKVKVIPITQIEDKSIPASLPKGIVTEKGIEVVQSYTATVGDKEQSTYQYLSAKPLNEIVKAFDEYLTKNKWAIHNKQDLSGGFNYVYTNITGVILTVSSVPSGDNKKHLITITLINKIKK